MINTWAVLGSGPSMHIDDAQYCRQRAHVLVINNTWEMAPWADALYTNDHDWLELNLANLIGTFEGKIYCGHRAFADVEGVIHVPFDKAARGLRPPDGHIAWGMNSGAAGISLVYNWFEAARVIMLGFDQQWTDGKPRWHGAHDPRLQNRKPGFHRWATWFEQAAADAAKDGREIVNCSRHSSLECFRRAPLREVI